MRHRFDLPPISSTGSGIVFEWDDETGELTGPAADRVRELAALAVGDGYVIGEPYPTSYAVSDPLRNPADLAAVLSQLWVLDDFLAAFLNTSKQESAGDIPGLCY